MILHRSLCSITPSSCEFPASSQLASIGYNLPNCTAIDSSTDLELFDSSNNSSECNNLNYLGATKVVGSATETYIGNLCKGMVNTFYVADSFIINASLAPLLPTNALQNYLDPIYFEQESQVPNTFSQTCQIIQRKILCGTLYPAAGSYSVYGIPVAVPRFPSNLDCIDYHNICKILISESPLLNLNCSGKINLGGGVLADSYPATTQLVAYALGSIPVYSTPYYLSNMTNPSVTTECPNGFAISSDIDASGQVAVTGNICLFNTI